MLLCFAAAADDLDSASREALDKTESLMKTPAERQKYIDAHPDAKAADKKIDDLTGDPQTKEMMYKTSGDIFADMVQKTNGDPEKQKAILDEAAKNPEAFYNQLTPEQKDQVRDLATKIQQSTRPTDFRY